MASVRLTRLEVWSDFECAGGVRLGFYQPVPASALRVREINGEETLTLQVYRDVDAWSLIVRDRVLRAHLATGDYYEYRIADIGQAHEKDGRVLAELKGESPLYDLGRDRMAHVLVNGDVLHDFPLADLTPTEHLNVALEKTTGFTSGAANWWTLGTVDFSDRETVNVRGYSALEYIRELQKVISADGVPCELEVARNGTSGYIVHLRTQVGAGAEKARLRWRRNLHAVRKTETAKDVPTRVYPFGQDLDGARFDIGGCTWEVGSVSSNDVDLLDTPIGFDDQFNGLYLEKPDGSLIEISDTVKASQRLTLASTPGVVPGDLIRIRKNSSGHELTYLDIPGSTAVRSENLERPDLPPVDNLVPNPFLNSWSAGLPVGFLKVGAPTVTEVNDAGKVLNGTRSAEIICLAEEQGLETDWIDVTPTESSPHFLAQLALYPVEGVWRFEILGDDGGGGITIPDGVGLPRAYTDQVGQWVERWSIQDQAINFAALGITRVKIRLIADQLDGVSGQASCYADAYQLVQTSLPELPFYGGLASRALWKAGNERLAAVADGAYQLEVNITDLFRMDSTAFPHDQLTLGGTVEVQDPTLGIVSDVRIRKIAEELMQEGATEIELSNRAEEVTDVDRLPAERKPATPRPGGSGNSTVDGNPVLDEDFAALYLHPNRYPAAKSIRYIVSDIPVVEADVLASGSTSDSNAAILLHTFTADREKKYVGVAYYPAPGGAGKVGGVHILTPYTFYTRDNLPVLNWRVAPAPDKEKWRITITAVDDGDQVAAYHRYYTDGGAPGAYTRTPGSGYVSDPYAFSVDVPKPATDTDPDVIFEAYAIDDATPENQSRLLQLRVKRSMVVPPNELKSVWLDPVTQINPGPPDTVQNNVWLYFQSFGPTVKSIEYIVKKNGTPVGLSNYTDAPASGTEGRTQALADASLTGATTTYECICTPYDAIGGAAGGGNPGPTISTGVLTYEGQVRAIDEAAPNTIVGGVATTFGEGLGLGAGLVAKLAIPNLIADAAPDGAADYVVVYDASAGIHKKVLLSNLPSATGGTLNGLSDVTITTPAAGQGLRYSGAAWVNVTWAIADISGLQAALDGKAASSHSHAISDVTGLQTALDGKAAASHTHAISDTTGLQAALDAKAALAGAAFTGAISGTSASFSGDVTSNTSDRRLKTDVRSVRWALWKLFRLRAVYYRWSQLAADSCDCLDPMQDRIGLFAQDVQKVAPEAIRPSPVKEGYLAFQPEMLLPVVVQGIQELAVVVVALAVVVAVLL